MNREEERSAAAVFNGLADAYGCATGKRLGDVEPSIAGDGRVGQVTALQEVLALRSTANNRRPVGECYLLDLHHAVANLLEQIPPKVKCGKGERKAAEEEWIGRTIGYLRYVKVLFNLKFVRAWVGQLYERLFLEGQHEIADYLKEYKFEWGYTTRGARGEAAAKATAPPEASGLPPL